MEVGECSEASVGEQPPLADLTVKVVSKGKGRAIDDAKVTVTLDRSGRSGRAGPGTVIFKKLIPGGYDIVVVRPYPDQDWITFLVHYPAVTRAEEAIALGHEPIDVAGSTTATVKIDYYRRLPKVTVRRNHIIWRPGRGDDKYGHWWTEIDGESYGWWPKDVVGTHDPPPELPDPLPAGASKLDHVQHMFTSMIARVRRKAFELRNSAPVQTLLGVEGELNGVTNFGGTPTQDPHAIDGDPGHEAYAMVITDEEEITSIKRRMRRFVRRYSGNWSWRFEFGQNCHTFQVGMLRAADLHRFRKL